MKKLLFLFTIVGLFASCKNKNKSEEINGKNMVLVDTSGLSNNNVLKDVGNNQFVIKDKEVNQSTTKKTVTSSPKQSSQSSSGNTVDQNNGGSSNNNSTTDAPAPIARDKGWSDAAKGTAIGAGSGAAIGAVVSKNNPGKGAVIGTAIGAGTGYIIGRSRDKKSGRVARSRARRAANQ